MTESDLILLSLVVFLPAAFGLAVLFFPKGRDEWVRWWALFGSAVTLVLSLCLFIDYYALLDSQPDASGRPLHSPNLTLEARADRAQAAAYAAVPGPRDSGDCLTRLPWVEQFRIDYFLGTDGISLPLILLT